MGILNMSTASPSAFEEERMRQRYLAVLWEAEQQESAGSAEAAALSTQPTSTPDKYSKADPGATAAAIRFTHLHTSPDASLQRHLALQGAM